jgi:hypothetical protein
MLNGWELEELHNVSALSPSTGDTIVYNASTSLWEKGKYPAGQLSGTALPAAIASSSLTSVGTLASLTLGGTITLPNSANNAIYTSIAADSAMPWANGPVLQGSTGWSFYSAVAGSYRMGFRGSTNGLSKYFWSADNVLIGSTPSDGSVTNTLNVLGTGRFTGKLTVTDGTYASITVGGWSSDFGHSAVEGLRGYLLFGNSVDSSIYLRGNNAGGAVHIGSNNQNTLIVGSSSATIYGGTGTTISGTTQTLINGSNNNSGIYLGGGTGNSATGGIEASWRDAGNPSIAIGVTRDGNRTMTVYEYANSRMYFYGGGVQQAYIDAGGTRIQNYYGAVKYGSYGSISVYEENNGWYGIVFPSQATTWMSAANGQYFGCYRNNNTWNFYVINGTFVPSDERYKRDIMPLGVGMNLLRLLEPISFDPLTEDPNDDPEATMGRINYGFTTQNVLASLQALGEPDNVNLVDVGGPTGANPETLSDRQYLNHSGLIAPIVKAIKELDSRLQQLEEANGSANAS